MSVVSCLNQVWWLSALPQTPVFEHLVPRWCLFGEVVAILGCGTSLEESEFIALPHFWFPLLPVCSRDVISRSPAPVTHARHCTEHPARISSSCLWTSVSLRARLRKARAIPGLGRKKMKCEKSLPIPCDIHLPVTTSCF